MGNSSKARPRRKPPPHPVLRVHHTGQWCKKIRGKLIYFGSKKLDPDGKAAEEQYLRERDFWQRGEVPPGRRVADPGKPTTLQVLVNRFLAVQDARQDADEISPRSFRDYYRCCVRLVAHFGTDRIVGTIQPSDFTDYRLKKLVKRDDGKDSSPASIKGGGDIDPLRLSLRTRERTDRQAG